MKLELLDGLQIKGPNCNLLYYYPIGNDQLHAQYWISKEKNEDVLHERIVETWNDAIICQLVFREMNGEDREDLVQSTNDLIKKLLAGKERTSTFVEIY